MQAGSCLEENTVGAFVAGRLTSGELEQVEAHLDVCDKCRSLIAGVRSQRADHPVERLAPAPLGIGAAGASELGPGGVIGDKYEVVRTLGSGGMGIVMEARHRELGQRVAIKLLREGLLDRVAVQRFVQEARALAQLRNDHVVRVYDVGKLETGTPYMVMELLEGTDLATLLKQCHELPPEQAVDHVLDACAGLAEAHAAGIVHRDLKPANLFLAEKPDGTRELKLIDFGIAKSLRSDSKLTADAMVLGSPRYMSPEQLERPADVDCRTDVWALGAILYRALSGRPAFDAGALELTLPAIIAGDRPRLAELCPELHVGLVAVVERCLEPNRERRFGSVAELARDLAPFGSPGAHERAVRIARVSDAPRPLVASQPAAQEQPTVPLTPVALPRPPLAPTVVTGGSDAPPPPLASLASLRSVVVTGGSVPPPPLLASLASLRSASDAPPRRSSVFKLAAIAAAAFGIVLIAVVTGGLGALTTWLARAEIEEAPLPALDPKRADPTALAPSAESLARKLDKDAELVAIDVPNPIANGAVDLGASQSVVFYFEYERSGGGEKGLISVEASDKGLLGTRVSFPRWGKKLPPPRCTLGDVWRAVTAAGVPADARAEFYYGKHVGKATWVVEVPSRHELLREVDAQSCAVVPVTED